MYLNGHDISVHDHELDICEICYSKTIANWAVLVMDVLTDSLKNKTGHNHAMMRLMGAMFHVVLASFKSTGSLMNCFEYV